MTRTLKGLIALVVVLVLVFMVVGNTRASDEPQVVRVTLKDYQIELSQFTVAPGKSIQFDVVNLGAVSHQFVLRPFIAAETSDAPDVSSVMPGTMWTIQRTLRPGVYRVACANEDHAKLGMVNALAAQANPQTTIPMQKDFVISILAFALGSAYIIGDSLGLRLTRKGKDIDRR